MLRPVIKRASALFCSFVLVAAFIPVAPRAAQASGFELAELPADVAVPGEVIVTYSDPAVTGSDVALAAGLSGAVDPSQPLGVTDEGALEIDSVEVLGEGSSADRDAIVKLVLRDEDQTAEAVAMLNALPGVTAQPNYRYQLIDEVAAPEPAVQGATKLLYEAESTLSEFGIASTNDPLYDELYYLFPWSDEPGAVCGSNIEAAWDVVKCEVGPAVVAVVDTGACITHEDLAANLDLEHAASIKDNSDELETGTTMYDSGTLSHGTHVSGTIAAIANNNIGVAGGSYNAVVLPIRIFRNSGGTSTSAILSACEYIEDLIESGEVSNLHVINMSLSGYDEPDEVDVALQGKIRELRNTYNVITVCAAGNGNNGVYTDPGYPSDYEECFAVTSLTKTGANYTGSDYSPLKDISAPGVDIYSTLDPSKFATQHKAYGYKTGTSMAAPVVSSIAAMLWCVNPDLTVDQAIEAMQATAHSVANKGNYHPPSEMGSPGAIDALAAVQYVQANYPSTRTPLSQVDAGSVDPVGYTGQALEPSISLTYEGTPLRDGVDFEVVRYRSNIEEGTGIAVARGLGDFWGEKDVEFSIVPNLSSGRTVVAPIAAQTYTGEEVEPVPSVMYAGQTLRNGTDFTLTYEDNVVGPVGYVIITGKGLYVGSTRAPFVIEGGPDEQIADGVAVLIEALPAPDQITQDDWRAIETAKMAVDALTPAQRAFIDDATLARWELIYAAYLEQALVIERLAGDTAAETAAKVSAATFESSEWVVLARDDDFADALGATGLAGVLHCPILLTNRIALSEAARAEVVRLGASKCIIIGGTGAMSKALDAQLGNLGVSVSRVWGENSYDTSLACAKEIVRRGGSSDRAIIAMSMNFQDALSMSSYAYAYGVPVVLQTWGDTSADRGFTDEAATWLDGKYLIVAGGPGAISDESVAVFSQGVRLAGDTGYDTSQIIATWMVGNGFLQPQTVVVACGAQAPKGVDALAGAALAGRNYAPIVLVNGNDAMEPVDTATVDGYITTYASDIHFAYVLGGSYVMPEQLYNRISEILMSAR